MLIANHYRRNSIAEYILYMWQIEDAIRACNFEEELIESSIISKFQLDDEQIKPIRSWYTGLVELMIEEQIKEKGHLQMVTNIINDMNQLHFILLNQERDKKYMELFALARPNIHLFQSKQETPASNDIETCFIALYSLLLLRLKKQNVTEDTTNAMNTFSNMIAYLSAKYKLFEKSEDL